MHAIVYPVEETIYTNTITQYNSKYPAKKKKNSTSTYGKVDLQFYTS